MHGAYASDNSVRESSSLSVRLSESNHALPSANVTLQERLSLRSTNSYMSPLNIYSLGVHLCPAGGQGALPQRAFRSFLNSRHAAATYSHASYRLTA